jgi:hypothetical protein
MVSLTNNIFEHLFLANRLEFYESICISTPEKITTGSLDLFIPPLPNFSFSEHLILHFLTMHSK